MPDAAIPRMALEESARPFLQPDEELLGVDFWVARRGFEKAATAPGVVLAKHMGVALTSRRLLIFRVGTIGPRVQELLTELPLAEVELETRGHWYKSFEVILRVGGVDHNLITGHIAHTDVLVKALESAKQNPS